MSGTGASPGDGAEELPGRAGATGETTAAPPGPGVEGAGPADEPTEVGGGSTEPGTVPPAEETAPGGGAGATEPPPQLPPAPDPLLPPRPQGAYRWPQIAAAVALFFAVVSLPLWVGQTAAAFLVDLLVLVALAQWWSLLAGFAGTPSLAAGLHAGTGAYVWLLLVERIGLNPVVAMAVAALVAAALAVPTGWLQLRLAAPWTALTGLVFGAAAAALVEVLDDDAAEGRSVAAVTALGSTLRRSLTTWLAVVLGVGSVVAAVALRRSRLGLAVVAHRDDAEAAATLGVRADRARLAVWAMAAGAAAMAGALVGFRSGTVAGAAAFDPLVWVVPPLVAAALGGMRSLSGPSLGALLYVIVERVVDAPAALAVCSIAAVVLLVAVPRGLADHAAPPLLARLGPYRERLRLREPSGSSTPPAG